MNLECNFLHEMSSVVKSIKFYNKKIKLYHPFFVQNEEDTTS